MTKVFRFFLFVIFGFSFQSVVALSVHYDINGWAINQVTRTHFMLRTVETFGDATSEGNWELFRSSYGVSSWLPIDKTQIPNYQSITSAWRNEIYAIAITTLNSGDVIVAIGGRTKAPGLTSVAILKSKDDGQSWEISSVLNLGFNSIGFGIFNRNPHFSVNGQEIYLVGEDSQSNEPMSFVYSPDNGLTWLARDGGYYADEICNFGVDFHKFIFDGATIYAGGSCVWKYSPYRSTRLPALLKSQDGGKTWKLVALVKNLIKASSLSSIHLTDDRQIEAVYLGLPYRGNDLGDAAVVLKFNITSQKSSTEYLDLGTDFSDALRNVTVKILKDGNTRYFYRTTKSLDKLLDVIYPDGQTKTLTLIDDGYYFFDIKYDKKFIYLMGHMEDDGNQYCLFSVAKIDFSYSQIRCWNSAKIE